MKSFETWVLSYLLSSLWQVPLIFAAGWVAAQSVKRAGAAMEHRVWVSVLCMQALVPAFATLPWEWASALLAWGTAQPRTAEAGVSVVMGTGEGVGAFHLPAALLTAIAIAYGAFTVYFAARFVYRLGVLWVMRREAREVALGGESAADWERCTQRFGVGEVSLSMSSRIFGPVTMGLTRKLVLLPEDLVERLSATDLRTVIAHEFAHLRRNDFLKNLIYELLSFPVSYHPLFWLTREKIMESREMVCDQMAATVAGRNEYAQSLLRLASLLVVGAPIRTPHAIGIFDANTFERRIMRLTGDRNQVKGMRRLGLVAGCCALGLGTCGLALALSMHVDAASVGDQNGASKQPGRISVSAAVMQGNIAHKVTPIYPLKAKKEKIEGKVVLAAIIGKDGAVENLAVVSGPKVLQQASLDAVRQWTYKPFLLNGNPVEVKTTVTVTYTLLK
jgi:TonB family protein